MVPRVLARRRRCWPPWSWPSHSWFDGEVLSIGPGYESVRFALDPSRGPVDHRRPGHRPGAGHGHHGLRWGRGRACSCRSWCRGRSPVVVGALFHADNQSLFVRGRHRRLPGRRLSGAAGRGDVRGRGHGSARVRGARPDRRHRRPAGHGRVVGVDLSSDGGAATTWRSGPRSPIAIGALHRPGHRQRRRHRRPVLHRTRVAGPSPGGTVGGRRRVATRAWWCWTTSWPSTPTTGPTGP